MNLGGENNPLARSHKGQKGPLPAVLMYCTLLYTVVYQMYCIRCNCHHFMYISSYYIYFISLLGVHGTLHLYTSHAFR